MAGDWKKEGLKLSRNTKIILSLVGIVLFLLCIVIVKVFMIQPATTVKLANIPDGEYDPAVWGKYYPLEYRSYQKNLEMAPSPTGFGGDEKIQKSVKEPELLINFKGMPFSKDYTYRRGHPYSVEDLKESKRIQPTAPGACMTCKSANLIDIYKEMGWNYAKTPIEQLLPRLKVPIVCANCHDPKTMNLRVINPAFIEAMERRGIDIKKATRQEMRSYVCGQCHSTYFIEPTGKRVVFPWDKGLLPEQMYAYYTEKPFGFEQDWVHPDSQVKTLKARHPDYETWISGVHGRSGVTCADCHMPYMMENGQKYTSHWVTSPMKRIQESCRPCHTQDNDWLLDRVKTIQNNNWQVQHIAGQTIARAHEILGKAGNVPKVNKEELEKSREFLRKAQIFWDLVAAENGMGFHNPDQDLNTLGRAIDMAHQAIASANRAAGTQY
jgi:nitrite reductase (cytochrome c-552)